MKLKKLFFLAAALAACAPSFAAVEVRNIRWQVQDKKAVAAKGHFADVTELPVGYDSVKFPRFRVAAELVNTSPRPADASIVRCAFYFRLVKISEPARPGVWAVPFYTEERRVSQIKPDRPLQIFIQDADMKPVLSRLRASGYWIDAIKVELMAEPRPGDDVAVVENIIPVQFR